mgnify:CR=1 FL=1
MSRASVEMRFEDGSTLSHFIKLEHTEQFSNPVDELTFVCAPPRDQIAEYSDRLDTNRIVSFRVNNKPQAACVVTRCEQLSDPDNGTIFSVTAKNTPMAITKHATKAAKVMRECSTLRRLVS